MEIYKKLAAIQSEVNCPKNLYNKFGEFYHRSLEGILESVKPVIRAHGCVLVLDDQVHAVGERYYVSATAVLFDVESGESVSATAHAREASEKKKLDDSQLTGTASSYARKYALGGLLGLDDAKDADSNEFTQQNQEKKTLSARQTGLVKTILLLAEAKGKKDLFTPDGYVNANGELVPWVEVPVEKMEIIKGKIAGSVEG